MVSTSEPPIDYQFRVCLVGDLGVGKSSLLLRFHGGWCCGDYHPTIGVEFKYRKLQIDSKVIKLQIWDTGGQERFKTITSHYYKNAVGFIVVYDIANLNSFENADKWLEEIKKYGPENAKILLVGNKSDLESERQVSTKEGFQKAEDLGFKFIETSAKYLVNIDEVLNTLASDMIAEHEKKSSGEVSDTNSKKITVEEKPVTKFSSCF